MITTVVTNSFFKPSHYRSNHCVLVIVGCTLSCLLSFFVRFAYMNMNALHMSVHHMVQSWLLSIMTTMNIEPFRWSSHMWLIIGDRLFNEIFNRRFPENMPIYQIADWLTDWLTRLESIPQENKSLDRLSIIIDVQIEWLSWGRYNKWWYLPDKQRFDRCILLCLIKILICLFYHRLMMD